jgi:hypothetical protein
VNIRARLVDPNIGDVIADYFSAGRGLKRLKKELLDQTRHTPRDFIQLLSAIQKTKPAGRVTPQQVRIGMRDYSINYFLPEIRDELVGYFDDKVINSGLELLGSLRKRDFLFAELKTQANSHARYIGFPLEPFVEALFECSAIGNVQRGRDRAHWHFKFRNRSSALNTDEHLVLHQGLWKALNLPGPD